ncbi:MAG: hypothetical protein LBD23_05885 [Oscillospiraceae bacterium]|jgi:predicted NBD/HSP70 family sugar kinase|nr:hypothetical protein [Oscillospiraceae bacterium]
MIRDFIDRAKRGESVYICEVRNVFNSLSGCVDCVVELPVGTRRHYNIPIPQTACPEEAEFIREYFYACIQNLISVLGGKRITMYIKPGDDYIEELCASLDSVFQTDKPRIERSGYGKCLNVTDRVNAAMDEPALSFNIIRNVYDGAHEPALNSNTDAVAVFRAAAKTAANAVICGMDIGGTDIKVVGAVNGRIAVLKEYDWRPSDMTTVDKLIAPITLLIKTMRVVLSLPGCERGNKLKKALLYKDSTDEEIQALLDAAEKEFGDFILFDGIGVNFPDVVIHNKIVGGETPKTHGIRENSADYETEFGRLCELEDILLTHCKQDGVVKLANDGSLAAYTAVVELAHSERAGEVADGVFAHTLGTDLGTGWIDKNGEIPQIPLELYNCIIDLGSYTSRGYDAYDVRSVRNFITGMSGTPQKYAGQFGAYRLAVDAFLKGNTSLYKELIDLGFIEENETGIFVKLTPQDMRKPLLEHIMELADNNNTNAMQVFREIGRFLAAIWYETEYMLCPDTKRRVLYGRFIKRRNCFKLMQEGVAEIHDITLDAGDDSLAFTPLMKDLKDNPDYTVAQFGQAVGAVYFAAAKIGKRNGY